MVCSNFSKIGLKTHSTMAMLSRSVLRLTGVLRAQPAFAVAKRMVTTDLSLEDEKAQFPSPPRRALLYLPGTLKLKKNIFNLYSCHGLLHLVIQAVYGCTVVLCGVLDGKSKPCGQRGAKNPAFNSSSYFKSQATAKSLQRRHWILT